MSDMQFKNIDSKVALLEYKVLKNKICALKLIR